MTEMPYLCWAFLYTSTGVNSYVELPMYLRVFREKLDANIRLVCTSNVQKFIDVNFLAAHADAPAYQDMYDFPKEYTRNRVPHSFLHDWADIFIILPCTANTLAKCANGVADNLLTMLVLCSPRPVVFFPNMGQTCGMQKLHNTMLKS
uniref:flavoprotein n=1 Tax=unclassified Geobacillus TaxID=2642459 RepID=UPI00403F4B49